jgi:hypothetical protein
MRKSAFAALVAVVALLAVMIPVASAAPLTDTNGSPNVTDDSPTGYFIFHDENGFHLRTHGPKAEHDFRAVLTTKGTFDGVDLIRLEPDDQVQLEDGGHRMVIHFHTFDGIDGVNFVVKGGDKLHLKLELDGQDAPTNQIYLGPQGRHPKHNPFSIKF